jgi:hypothetical protein
MTSQFTYAEFLSFSEIRHHGGHTTHVVDEKNDAQRSEIIIPRLRANQNLISSKV